MFHVEHTPPAALRFSHVVKRYGSVYALKEMNLTVPMGSICGFVGPNGAGKTTAMGVAAGLLKNDGGEVDVLGMGPFDPDKHRGLVTLLPQDCDLNPYTPVRDLLIYYARVQGLTRMEAERDADRLIEAMSLNEKSKARIRELSHGMRRRVTIAQAFVGKPKLVMLDEPVSGLDPHLVVQVRDFFLSVRGQSTLLISSHQLPELEAVCDAVIFVEGGKVIRSGTMAEITRKSQTTRITIEGPPFPDPERLSARTPGLHWMVEGNVCVVNGAAEVGITALNHQALTALMEMGVGIMGVQPGQSLEQTYLSSRKPL